MQVPLEFQDTQDEHRVNINTTFQKMEISNQAEIIELTSLCLLVTNKWRDIKTHHHTHSVFRECPQNQNCPDIITQIISQNKNYAVQIQEANTVHSRDIENSNMNPCMG
jgi:hypothetical protein